MKQKDLTTKAALLKDGQIVEIAGDWFRAIRLNSAEFDLTCDYCDLDSICHGDVSDVCRELETSGSSNWILKLAHP